MWHSEPHNDFTRRLFSEHNVVSAPGLESVLCGACAQIDLSQPGFTMSKVVDDIDPKAIPCELCSVFAEVAAELKVPRGQMLSCYRDKSTLLMHESRQPIFSIYADPGKEYPASNFYF